MTEILLVIIVAGRWKVLHWIDYDHKHTKSATRYSTEASTSPMRLRKYSTDGINAHKLCKFVVCLLDIWVSQGGSRMPFATELSMKTYYIISHCIIWQNAVQWEQKFVAVE